MRDVLAPRGVEGRARPVQVRGDVLEEGVTVYELIQRLANYEPDKDVSFGVIPAGNRKIKDDLEALSVSPWSESYSYGDATHVVVMLRRKGRKP